MKRTLSLMLALGIGIGVLNDAEADWPHLRGSKYDGVSLETGLAENWPAAGPPLLWTRELGQGHSGFTIADGKLFTQRQVLGGQFVVCMDPETGATIWETRYDWSWQPSGAYPGPYASPTWNRDNIFYTSPTGLVGCINSKNGTPIWSLNVRERFQGKGYGFGYAATPLVEGDRVILPVGGPNASLVALHADDGKVLWTAGSDPSSYSSVMPITFQGRRYIVGFLENALIIVEPVTGKIVFRQKLSSGYDEHAAWPLYKEPHLMLASPMRVPAKCFELQAAGDELLCKPRWASKEMCNDVVSSVLYGGHVYGFDLQQLQASPHRASRGSFKCIDWSTGKLNWSAEEVGHATVVVADGKLFLLNDEGTLVLARAEPTAYQELARTQLFNDEICWTPPMISQGRLFARSPSRAVCAYVGRPEHMPKSVSVAPTISTHQPWRFNPAWLASREREYPNDAPTWQEMAEWFGACILFAFGGAMVVTLAICYPAKWVFGKQFSGVLLFLLFTFVFGLLGPNGVSAWLDEFLFTWPVSLYAALHATVIVCWKAERAGDRQTRWLARFAMLGFVLVCYGYYLMCKVIGMFVGWSFLFGFFAAFPFTLLAVRSEMMRQNILLRAAWTVLAFSAFFWSCQALLLWKAAQTTTALQ